MTMNRMKVADRKELLSDNIWLWGAGGLGKCAYGIIKMQKHIIKGFIDNATKIQGQIFDDVKVFSPNEAFRIISRDDLVICCCNDIHALEIIEQLEENGIYNYRKLDISAVGDVYMSIPEFLNNGYEYGNISRICDVKEFDEDYFKTYMEELKRTPRIQQRKDWEFVYILKVLNESGCLNREISRGIGFAVGEEPLPAYFAARHVSVLATDLGIENEYAKIWATTGQNAAGDLSKLYKPDICSREEFNRYVAYRDVDMNSLPSDLCGKYDFCWSSCAIEHVGSLEKSKLFLKKCLDVLKPGGVAVHTTEFNVSSNENTITDTYSVIYRRKDIEEICEWCKENGHQMEVSFVRTNMEGNKYVDIPPYFSDKTKYHLNLFLDGFVSTSYGIVMRKGKK